MVDKTITAETLVTGGAGGIGGSIVAALLKNNHSVTVADNNHDTLERLTNRFPGVSGMLVDLSNPDEVNKLSNDCLAKNIKNIVHCAGYGGPFEVTENTTYETWRRVFAINVDSLFLLSRAVLPSWKSDNYGRIVAISSIQGNLGSNGSSAYVASKHALNGLIKTIAAEYGASGITANGIAPGYIESPMGTQGGVVTDYTQRVLARTPTKSEGRPSQIASLVTTLLRPDMEYLNGSIITIDGGISSSVGVL